MKKTLAIAACMMFLLAGEAIAFNWQVDSLFGQNLFNAGMGNDTSPCQDDMWNLINGDGIFNIDTQDPCFDILNDIIGGIDDCFLIPPMDFDFCHIHRPPSCDVPEPASLLLFGLGLIGLAGVRRKLRK